MEAKLVPQIEKNTPLFYRGQTSRKPYKVRFVRIVGILTAEDAQKIDPESYKSANLDEVVGYNIEVEFSSLKREHVRSCDLFVTWQEAKSHLPLREKRIQGQREITVTPCKNLLLEDGQTVCGFDVRLGHLDAGITSEEAETLWRKLAEELGYQIPFLHGQNKFH